MGVAPVRWVKRQDFTGEKVWANGARKALKEVAWVEFKFGGKVFRRKAMVDMDRCHPPECWFPLNLKDAQEVTYIAGLFQEPEIQTAKVNQVTTRGQAKQEASLKNDEGVVTKPLDKAPARRSQKQGGGAPAKEQTTTRKTEANSGSRVPEAGKAASSKKGARRSKKRQSAAQEAVGGATPPSVEVTTQYPAEEESVPEAGEESGSPAVDQTAAETVTEEEEEAEPAQELPKQASCKAGVVVVEEASNDSNESRGSSEEVESKRVEDSCEKLVEAWKPIEEGEERSAFIKEVERDESLLAVKEFALRGEKGYKWRGGVLVQTRLVDWEEFADVVLVPRSYRKRLMEIGHDRCGHFGSEKVLGIIRRRFSWPGMVKDVQDYCQSCETCKRHSNYGPRRAPMMPRPVLTEPFESVALDIVGPLEKGKGGCQYLLTCICLASKWPDAVPLRVITTKSVAHAMWEVFSRIGIPQQILTDCGAQFMAKAMKELCTLMGVDKLKTTPYHPESNGSIERMHRTLKSIIRKTIESRKDWVQQVPYAVFSLRSLPLEGHGFTPFDLVHGFRQRTPLEAVYHNLVEQQGEQQQQQLLVSEWVDRMASTMEAMRETAALGAAKCAEQRKKQHDKSTRLRSFSRGDLVWYRIPGMHNKLGESWDGPFEVVERKGDVTYKIKRKGKVRGEKVIHVNNLMRYCVRKDVCRIDVVLDEEEEGKEAGAKLSGECVGYNVRDIEDLVEEFDGVFCGETGTTDVVKLRIDTKDAQPIAQPPYSVPLSMREDVRAELKALEEAGIIQRSDSSWASPLVPVKKKNGKVRLCVDYRKVNAITTPEPYYMPGFEEMVSKIGEARVLSKLDLVKGFHQVEVHPDDIAKTAFICPWGKWECRRMPFGLCNAPATFQKLMNRVLSGCEEFCNVYIDDILVGSSNWLEHLAHLRIVFNKLEAAGLTCQVTKCDFGKKHLEFLGHRIGDGEMCVPEHRVTALVEYRKPSTKKQLRAFLGTVNFYRKYIPKIHQWTSKLTPATSDAMPASVKWEKPMEEAFSYLCKSLVSHVSLCIPTCNDEFVVETDASATGVGGVLSIRRKQKLHPVAYYSSQLQGAEKNYAAQDLEGLALVKTIRHFSFFLYGRPFEVITDHKSLTSITTGPQRNKRILRWALELTNYMFSVVYRKGTENTVADWLSRQCGEDQEMNQPAQQLSATRATQTAETRGGRCERSPSPSSNSSHKESRTVLST